MLKTATPTLGPRVDACVSEPAFREALRHFASGVTIITTRDDRGGVHGMTATAFSSLSLRPPLVLVAVAKSSRCHRMVVAEKQFGINILSSDQEGLSRHFGGRPSAEEEPRFVDFEEVPVLAKAMVRLSCGLQDVVEGGDHSIFVGYVRAVATSPGDPLLHFNGSYHMLERGRLR